jgi:hypothetical protein
MPSAGHRGTRPPPPARRSIRSKPLDVPAMIEPGTMSAGPLWIPTHLSITSCQARHRAGSRSRQFGPRDTQRRPSMHQVAATVASPDTSQAPSKCWPRSIQARWLPGLPRIPRQPANHITSGAPPGPPSHRHRVPVLSVTAAYRPSAMLARGLRSRPPGAPRHSVPAIEAPGRRHRCVARSAQIPSTCPP